MQAVFVKCYEPGGLHEELMPYAVIGLFVYSIGFPAIVALILLTHQTEIREDQLLRAHDLGDRPNENVHYKFRLKFHKLYYQFKPDYYYWMLL